MSSQLLTQASVESESQTGHPLVIGRPLKRKEDIRILTGHTRYVDDIRLPMMLYGAVLRSSYAHARIKNIDASRTMGSAGVRLVLTAKDLPDESAFLSVFESEDGFKIKRPVLASEEVRYFGEPIAFVVACSKYEAEDALETIAVEYEPLEAITDPAIAANEGSALCHSETKSNLVLIERINFGDSEKAFQTASQIVKLDLLNQRISPAPIEPRGAVAHYDEGTGMLSLWISTQGPFQSRSEIAEKLELPENKVRVYAPDVGGGFGAKLSPYSEDILVCLSAIRLGQPVKWVETRSENFSSMTHGRGQVQHVELASTEDGRILGLKVHLIGDVGAYMTEMSGDATFSLKMAPGQYIIPAYEGEAEIVLTNKVPHDAYRGASRPEAIYLIERAIDELAHSLGIDPAEVRLRNFIPREDFPFKNAGGLKYDTGDYAFNLKKALDLANYDKLKEEQRRARENGRLMGIGVSTYVEICAFGPDFPQTAAISVGQTGKVTVISGTSPHGQGHETPLAQIVAEKLGISIDDVFVTYGDTAMLPWGTFTAGSRSGALGGSAVLMCAEKIKNKMAKIASKALEVSGGADEIVFKDGQIYHKSTANELAKRLSFRDVASYAYEPERLPPEMEPVLYAFSCFVPPSSTFPFGTHIAVAEVEKETGRIKILDYVSVDDCGKVLNPMIVEGQIHGGIAQGLGQALLEGVSYDENGQLLTSSFLDYQIPSSVDVPDVRCFRTETPTFANPLGIKGVGEAGTIAATPALANAVYDALSPLGVKLDEMPFSLDYIKRLIKDKEL